MWWQKPRNRHAGHGEAINRVLTGGAKREGIETGRKTRFGSTPVEANIHSNDSYLLPNRFALFMRA